MSAGVVLVTGASGTVGSAVVKELQAIGVPVRAAVRRLPPTTVGTVASVPFDFAESDTWRTAFDGVDRLFLLRPPAISDVRTYLRPLIRLAEEYGVRHVVFLSVMGVNRFFPHWRVERDIEDAGLPHTFLRPAFFAQNLLNAYRHDIVEHSRIRLASGRGRTCFIDTRDVAAVAALALAQPCEHAGATYVLTGPEALTYHQVTSMLSARLGRPIDYEPIGLLRYRRELLADGLDRSYVNVQLVINAAARLGLADSVNSQVRALLGRDATPLSQFIADHASRWQHRPEPDRGVGRSPAAGGRG